MEEYLATAQTDLDFTGFASEADYQSYLRRLLFPPLLQLVATLLSPERDDDGHYRAMCRTLMAGNRYRRGRRSGSTCCAFSGRVYSGLLTVFVVRRRLAT